MWDADLRPPLAVLLGSEGAGLPEDVLAAADLRVAIPMTGTAESLNLAVAAGHPVVRDIPALLAGERGAVPAPVLELRTSG